MFEFQDLLFSSLVSTEIKLSLLYAVLYSVARFT